MTKEEVKQTNQIAEVEEMEAAEANVKVRKIPEAKKRRLKMQWMQMRKTMMRKQILFTKIINKNKIYYLFTYLIILNLKLKFK